MGKQIKIQRAVINWPQLLTAAKSRKYPNNAPKFGCVIILDPTAHAASINEIAAALTEQAEVFKGGRYDMPPSWATQPDGQIHLRVSCPEDRPPQVVDESVQKVFDAAKIYSGAVCNFVIDAYPSVANNKVCLGLLMVQFAMDGPRLDNRPEASEFFQPIPVQNVGAPVAAPGAAPVAAPVAAPGILL